jgi:OmpA-OmpF porin, OOP family
MPTTGPRALCALAFLLAVTSARAEDPGARGFDPDPARPALSVDGGLVVETAAAARPGTRAGAVVLDYASGLLALRLGGERDDLLASRLSAHLLAAYALPWLEVGVHLPVALRQDSDFSLLERQGVTGALVAPVSGSALGDLRLVAKVPLLAEARGAPVGVAALLDLRAPTGDGDAFTGDGPMAVPGVVATRTLGKVRLDAQVGYAIRDRAQYAQLVVHDGLTYGAGASLELPPAGAVKRWKAMLELAGGWPRGHDGEGDRYRAPLSARAGVRAWVARALAVEAGAGAGLGDAGYGRERWRVFAGVRWVGGEREGPADAVTDGDRDGVPDASDACPDVRGSPELDGCPDRDADTIPDPQDRCPDEPGPATNEGCPVLGEPLIEVETDRLSMRDAINFDTGRDTIRPESNRVLDAIAGVLTMHPELRRVRVEGHTDDVGAAAYNRDLSQRRAQSVVRALVARGISKDRLIAQGYGFDRPVASNATALGRAKNRRVEFTILSEE